MWTVVGNQTKLSFLLTWLKKNLYWPLDVQLDSFKNPGPGPDHFPWKILQVQSSMVRRPTSPDQATVLVIKLMSAGVSDQYQTLTYWFKNTNSLLSTTLFWNQDGDVVWSMMLILLIIFPPHQSSIPYTFPTFPVKKIRPIGTSVRSSSLLGSRMMSSSKNRLCHTIPIRIPKDVGMVKGVPLLGAPEITFDFVSVWLQYQVMSWYWSPVLTEFGVSTSNQWQEFRYMWFFLSSGYRVSTTAEWLDVSIMNEYINSIKTSHEAPSSSPGRCPQACLGNWVPHIYWLI